MKRVNVSEISAALDRLRAQVEDAQARHEVIVFEVRRLERIQDEITSLICAAHRSKGLPAHHECFVDIARILKRCLPLYEPLLDPSREKS